jgi:hypothetical protein
MSVRTPPSDQPTQSADPAARKRDFIGDGAGGYSVVEFDPGGAPVVVGRIVPMGGLFRAYQYDNQRRETILATLQSVWEAQAVFVQSKGADDDPNALRTIDWIALGLLTLTVVLGVSTALVTSPRPPTDLEVTLANDTMLFSFATGIAGLVLGLTALSSSGGRPKWPGILALFSPVVAVFLWVLAFAAAGGMT